MNRVELKQLSKDQLRGHWKIPILTTIIFITISFFLTLVEPVNAKNKNIFFLYILASMLISTYITVWYHYFYLKFVKDPDSVVLSDIVIFPKLIWRAIKGMVLMLILLYIPIFIIYLILFTETLSLSQIGILLSICIITILFFLIIYIQLALFPFFYIICEYPNKKIFTAFNDSFKLTKGHKLELFILSLSFLGWLLVGVFTFGIGLLWVTPYINATMTNYYVQLKANSQLKSDDAIILK